MARGYGGGWAPYVPVADAPEKGRARGGETAQKRAPGRPCHHRGAHHRQDLLGQGVVRHPGKLSRLREPPATRPHLCPQWFGRRPSDIAARDQGDGQRVVDLQGHRHDQGVGADPVAVDLRGLRRRDRFADRTAARPVLQGGDGADLPSGQGPVSQAVRNPLLLHLPGRGPMCKHVAAVLYGVGARLDERPELLFQLRAVDENDLVAGLDEALPLSNQPPDAGKSWKPTTFRPCLAWIWRKRGGASRQMALHRPPPSRWTEPDGSGPAPRRRDARPSLGPARHPPIQKRTRTPNRSKAGP